MLVALLLAPNVVEERRVEEREGTTHDPPAFVLVAIRADHDVLLHQGML